MKTETFRQIIRETEKNAIIAANGDKAVALRIISLAQGACIGRDRELSALCIAKSRIANG